VTRRLVILAFAGLAAVSSGEARADDEILAAAAACAERLRAAEEAAESSGEGNRVVRLADICPALPAELEGRIWGEALVFTSAESLSARSFGELVTLIEHYQRATSDTSELQIDELARIVESLGALEAMAELSPWERIVRFVRQRLGLDEDGDARRLLNWLRRIAIPDAWQRGIVVTLGILAVTVVLVVVAHELAARRAARAAHARGGDGDAPRERLRAIDEIARAPAASQPSLLLALLFARLRERFGDAVRESMTPRELATCVGTLGLAHRDDFDVVAAAAERVTFAGWHPRPADAAAVLARARAVLDELDGNKSGRMTSGR